MVNKKDYLVFKFLFASVALSVISSVISLRVYYEFDEVINWTMLETLASILMCIITSVAVYIAIIIPQKDRIFSLKIELFNQRYETYYLIKKGLEDIYLNGESNIDVEEYKKVFHKTLFILQPRDNEKIIQINNDVLQKFFIKESDPNLKVNATSNDINDELVSLMRVFLPYLNLNSEDK